MYTTLLFDLDGTLIDSAADIAASVNHARRHFGQPDLTLDQVKAAVGDGLVTLLERTVPADGAEAKRVYTEHHEGHLLDHTSLYPGVREGLESLVGKVALGVVTNKPQGFTERILKGLDLERLFSVVVGGDTAAGKKPDPGPILLAMQRIGAAPWSTLYVGDSKGDVRAAHAANTAACTVAWGFRAVETLRPAHPDHEVTQFAQIVAQLELQGDRPKTVFEKLGAPTFWTLARAFYARVDQDSRIRAMFPPFLDTAIEHQALFFIQFFGGPSDYAKQRGHPRLRMRHAPFPIDEAAARAWLENMLTSMEEVGITGTPAGVMRRYFAHTAAFLINRGG